MTTPDLIAELAEVVSIIDTVRGMTNGTFAHSAGLCVEASACARFLRIHHAELEAMARDAARLDSKRIRIDDIEWIGLDLRAAIDAAMRDSAREDSND